MNNAKIYLVCKSRFYRRNISSQVHSLLIYFQYEKESQKDLLHCKQLRYWDAHTQTYMTPHRNLNPRLGRWTSPDPLFWGPANIFASPMEAANLFVFVMNNPVMWIDPSGLVAVNIREFARTFDATATLNVKSSGGEQYSFFTITAGNTSFTISGSQKSLVNGNWVADCSLFVNALGVGTSTYVLFQCPTTSNVSIRGAFNIKGDGADLFNDGTTYRALFLAGVEEWWSGTFGRYNVSTHARESATGISVTINVGFGISNVRFPSLEDGGWSSANPGRITMYRGDYRNTIPKYTAAQFRWVAAHEFGHIMGVRDTTARRSIFNTFGTPVQQNDMTTVIRAWNNQKVQRIL